MDGEQNGEDSNSRVEAQMSFKTANSNIMLVSTYFKKLYLDNE